MRNEGLDRSGSADGCSDLEKQEKVENSAPESGGGSKERDSVDKDASAVISVVISRGDACNQVPVSTSLLLMGNASKVAAGSEKEEKADSVTPKKGCLSRSESNHEQCRVCHQQSEEALIDLGCRCRGELAKAHRSCIDIWFHTRGSNKCEICQQVATNVPSPESHPSGNNWIWWVDPTVGRSNFVQRERERGCFSPLWIAFSILIGGLLLDVLISISLGVSALPVNIIIGVLVVLGFGTALRLTLECCREWNSRRAPSVDTNINLGYHPAV